VSPPIGYVLRYRTVVPRTRSVAGVRSSELECYVMSRASWETEHHLLSSVTGHLPLPRQLPRSIFSWVSRRKLIKVHGNTMKARELIGNSWIPMKNCDLHSVNTLNVCNVRGFSCSMCSPCL